jgi:hypothetical protein
MSDKQIPFEDMPKPIGEFILSQKDIAYMQMFDGAWFHYKDVCTLLNRYAASQPPAVRGTVWVKASERLPKKLGKENSVIVRGIDDVGNPFVAYGFSTFSGLPTMYYELGSKSFVSIDVEWLDESGESPTATGDGKEAIEFSEWLVDNTEIIREEKVTLYRYCNKMNEWGNYTLNDIYAEYKDL